MFVSIHGLIIYDGPVLTMGTLPYTSIVVCMGMHQPMPAMRTYSFVKATQILPIEVYGYCYAQ